jgi:hypothetical protein
LWRIVFQAAMTIAGAQGEPDEVVAGESVPVAVVVQ